MWDVGKQLAGGLFVLILFFGLLRPAVKSLMAKPTAATIGGGAALASDTPALAGPGTTPALPSPPREEIAMPGALHENIEQLQQIVAQDPRVAAQVIKEWVGD